MGNIEIQEVKSDTERPVKVKSLFIHTLLRWKLILVIGVIGALISAFGNYSDQVNAIKATSSETSSSDKELYDYDAYYDEQMEDLDKNITERYDYLNQSIVSDMNPYNTGVATVVLYVGSDDAEDETTIEYPVTEADQDSDTSSTSTTDEESTNTETLTLDSKTDTILVDLQNKLDYGIDWDFARDELDQDLEDLYYNELLEAETSGSTITANFYYTDEDTALTILKEVVTQLETEFDSICEKIGASDYTITVLQEESSTVVYPDNFNWLHNRLSEINNLKDDQENLENGYSDNVSSYIHTDVHTVNMSEVARSGIRGFFIGLLVMLILVFAWLIISDRVLASSDVNDYYQLQKLAVLNPRRKGVAIRGLNKKILRMSRENRSALSDDARLQLAADAIGHMDTDFHKIAVVTDSGEDITSLASDLGKHLTGLEVVAVNDIINSIEARERLHDADAVVLAVYIEESKYSTLRDVFKLNEYYKKTVLGTIVI